MKKCARFQDGKKKKWQHENKKKSHCDNKWAFKREGKWAQKNAEMVKFLSDPEILPLLPSVVELMTPVLQDLLTQISGSTTTNDDDDGCLIEAEVVERTLQETIDEIFQKHPVILDKLPEKMREKLPKLLKKASKMLLRVCKRANFDAVSAVLPMVKKKQMNK